MPFFVHRIFTYSPSKPRHPLLRLVIGLLGLVLLAVLVVVGLFVGLGMLMFAAVRRMMRAPVAAPRQVRFRDRRRIFGGRQASGHAQPAVIAFPAGTLGAFPPGRPMPQYTFAPVPVATVPLHGEYSRFPCTASTASAATSPSMRAKWGRVSNGTR
jgi:hypothetical protein